MSNVSAPDNTQNKICATLREASKIFITGAVIGGSIGAVLASIPPDNPSGESFEINQSIPIGVGAGVLVTAISTMVAKSSPDVFGRLTLGVFVLGIVAGIVLCTASGRPYLGAKVIVTTVGLLATNVISCLIADDHPSQPTIANALLNNDHLEYIEVQ